MNIVIVGGLLLLGVAALVALFFVIREEQTDQADTSIGSHSVEKSEPGTRQTTQEPSLAARTLPLPAEPSHKVQEERWVTTLGGQFHELSVELQTLHEQSREIETRFNRLMSIVEHIEHSQDGHPAMRDEPSYPPRAPIN